MLGVGMRRRRGEGEEVLGFRGIGGMEEEEEEEEFDDLEEGEAVGGYYGHRDCGAEDDGADKFVDPDALTYIDERLQDMLGHFQKNFEGEVSAENLGPQFGGYGSFLPTYQRSPSVMSQSRSPAPPNHISASRSRYVPGESAQQNPSATTNSSVSRGHTSALDITRKNNYCQSTPNEVDSNPPRQLLNKVANGYEQKSLKVRIKVGNDNALARNNAAIYSGLGLDISPSLSMDDSLDGSAGASESQVVPDESPDTILQIMTCLSVPGGFLLSPLQGNFLELKEKTTPLIKKHKTPTFYNSSAESLRNLSNTAPDAQYSKDRMPKKMKSDETSYSTPVLNKEIHPVLQDLSDDIDSTVLSTGIKREQHCIEESAKFTGGILDRLKETKNAPLKGRICDNISSRDMGSIEVLAVNSRNDDKHPKVKANTNAMKVENVFEEQSTSCNKEPLHNPTEYKVKDQAFLHKVKYELDDYNGQSITTSNHTQKIPIYITTPHERGKEKANGVKEELFEEKQKEMGSLINMTASTDTMRDNAGVHSSGTLKGKKRSSTSCVNQSEKKVKLKPHKEQSSGIIRKSHGDTVINALEDKNGLNSLDKDTSAKSEKDTVTCRVTSKDRAGNGNDGNDNICATFVEDPASMPSACNAVTTESAIAAPVPAPVLIKEEWVGCDKCQKWRLLPYGMNPDKFPKQWQCSMMDWLPGMNSCKISEDETTKALHALYMVPAPETNINSDAHRDIAASGISTATTLPTFEDSKQSIISAGKWKNGSNDGTNMSNNLNLTEMLKPLKKLQAPNTSRNLDDVDYNPAAHGTSENGYLDPGYKSSDKKVKKHISKHKEKRKSLGSSDKGESVSKGHRHQKLKIGVGADYDDLKTPKKVKIESNEPVNHQQSEFEVGKSSSSTKAILKNVHKYSGLSPGMEKYDSKVVSSSSSKQLHDEDQIFSDGGLKTSDAERPGQPASSNKKRKVKQWQFAQCDPEALTSNQRALSKPEALSESKAAKEKPTTTRLAMKVSKTDDPRFSSNKAAHANLTPSRGPIAGVDNAGGAYAGNDHLNEQFLENLHSQRSLFSENSTKRNMSYAQASTAATSSSSKVSTSHMSKADFQETRGSPVESVSSSPLRTCDKSLLDQHRRYSYAAAENVYAQDSGKSGSSCSKEKHDIGSDSDQALANVAGCFNGDVNPCDLNNREMWKDNKDLSKRDLKEKCSGLGQKDEQSDSRMEQKLDAHGSAMHANNDHKLLPSHQNEKMLLRFHSDQNEHPKISGKDSTKVKSDKEKVDNKYIKIVPSSAKGSKQQPSSNGTGNNDASNMAKQSRKDVIANGSQHNMKQSTLNGDTSSPINASVVLKEARDLKHLSKRLKEKGDDLESTSICFEAVLKFLCVASLWEPRSVDNFKQGDVTQAMQMYSQTGNLCGFCAHEFERLKKMANAALAYKCVEVAYMKAAFYKHPGAMKDRHALQAAPMLVPPVDSPSSSASDVDNLNNQSTFARAVSAKGVYSPHIANNHISRSNHHLMGLLAYAEEINYAFAATKKSQVAFSAYMVNAGKDQADGIAFVREVLDFNFHNVKGLLHLIRLSMESINHESVKQ